MTTPIFFPHGRWFPLLCLICCATIGLAIHAPAQCPNPAFPTCQPPSAFKIMLVLDESGSVAPVESDFEDAVTEFATALRTGATATGQFEMGIVEFNQTARLGMALTDVRSAGFLTDVGSYLSSDYDPGGSTSFVDALNFVLGIRDLDIIFFISDGNPNGGNTGSSIADDIKCDLGTYIFGVALGNGINVGNIQAISGPHQLSATLSLIDGADWMQQNVDGLGEALVELANSIIDNTAPALACPANITVNSDPGICGALVDFDITANDECTDDLSVSISPTPGSEFPLGPTVVTATISDEVGNSSDCSFTVTVTDNEAPAIACPADITISCEAPIEPTNTGEPTVSDNCGVDAVNHSDIRTDGACPNEFKVTRSWIVTDVNDLTNSCEQTIQVIDDMAPVIACPDHIVVACDTSTAETGLATVLDNCTASPDLTYADVVVSGDCEWNCLIERTWTTTDACGNTSTCVQEIEKDVTPLVTDALDVDVDGDGLADPLVLGVTETTLTMDSDDAACIVGWFPYDGTAPDHLERHNGIVGPDCLPGINPVNGDGKITNPLFGETLKLALYLRLDPSFGDTKVADLGCEVAPIVLQAMAPDPDVNEFIRVTQMAVGNRILTPFLQELLDALKCITGPLDLCDNEATDLSTNR